MACALVAYIPTHSIYAAFSCIYIFIVMKTNRHQQILFIMKIVYVCVCVSVYNTVITNNCQKGKMNPFTLFLSLKFFFGFSSFILSFLRVKWNCSLFYYNISRNTNTNINMYCVYVVYLLKLTKDFHLLLFFFLLFFSNIRMAHIFICWPILIR